MTKRQKEILDYVAKHVEENGYAPTLQEIGSHFGL
ncbi:MAG TPA: repressor LexA, partial [Acidobacteria bacterium]|nr:repressor LexA [Acidobacteriota bacterium]